MKEIFLKKLKFSQTSETVPELVETLYFSRHSGSFDIAQSETIPQRKKVRDFYHHHDREEKVLHKTRYNPKQRLIYIKI